MTPVFKIWTGKEWANQTQKENQPVLGGRFTG